MVVSKNSNTLNIFPEENEYLKISVISSETKILFEDIVDKEINFEMTYIGKYELYISSTENFLDTPNYVFYNYDLVIDNIICKFLNLICPCENCKPYNPCESDCNTKDEILCLYNEVTTLTFLFPEELNNIFGFIVKAVNNFYREKSFDNLHRKIYNTNEDCCEEETLEMLSIYLLTLYYIYVRLHVDEKEYVDKLFKIQQLLKCIKSLGICVNTILESLDEEYGTLILPPTFKGFVVHLTENAEEEEIVYTFNQNQFLNQYTDPQNLDSKNLKIISLPDRGILKFNNSEINILPFIIPVSDIGNNITYTTIINLKNMEFPPKSSLINNNDINNKFESDSFIDYDSFLAQISNTEDLYSNSGEISIKAKEYSNKKPSQIGNNNVEIPNRSTLIFTKEDFTTETTPIYQDPENDDLNAIKILSINLSGNLYVYNSYRDTKTPVQINQIISVDILNSGLLRYDSPDTDKEKNGQFIFSVRDSGSNKFFSQEEYGVFLITSLSINNTAPIALDDIYNVNKGSITNLNIKENDSDPENDPLEIQLVSQPQHGIATVINDQVRYAHDNSNNFTDVFTYRVFDGHVLSNIATVTILVSIPCSESISANSGIGVYETLIDLGTDTGLIRIDCEAMTIPDRFMIEYDGQIVADSLYIGSNVERNYPYFEGLLGTHNLPVFRYNGNSFTLTNENREITVIEDDIKILTDPNYYDNGEFRLSFEKTSSQPTVAKLIAFSPVIGTRWDVWTKCPKGTQEKIYFGDVHELPINSEQVINNLESSSRAYNKTYTFLNEDKRKNVILVPKQYILDTVVTSSKENIRPNFRVKDFEFTDELGQTSVWDMYYHSSVLPLNVEINFTLRQ